MKIELTDNIPVSSPYRSIPPHLYKEVKTYIQELVQHGWVRQSRSPYSSPIVGARKPDGTIPTANDMTMPRGHNFDTVYDGVTYNFVNTTSVVPTRDGLNFSYPTVDIVQGQYITDSFVFESQITKSKFVFCLGVVGKIASGTNMHNQGTFLHPTRFSTRVFLLRFC